MSAWVAARLLTTVLAGDGSKRARSPDPQAVDRASPVAFESSGDLLRLVRARSIRGALVRKATRARGGCSCETARDERHLPLLLRSVEPASFLTSPVERGLNRHR
jgi:hypothetical protein